MATRKKKNAPAEQAFPTEDYDAIEAAVMETARGRWFLKEYARRNRVIEATTIETSMNELAERLESYISQHSAGDGVLEQLTMMRTQLSENTSSSEPPAMESDAPGPIDDVSDTHAEDANALLESTTATDDSADIFETGDEFDAEAFLFAEAAPDEAADAAMTVHEEIDHEPIATASEDPSEVNADLEFAGEDPLFVDASAQPETEIEDGAFIIDDLDFSGKSSELPETSQIEEELAGDVFDESSADAEFEALDLPTAEPSENDIVPEPGDQTVILSEADKSDDAADVFATNVQILPAPGDDNYPLTKHAVGAGGRIEAIAEGQIDVELDEELLEELSEADKSALFS